MTASFILAILAVTVFLEGLFVAVFPQKTKQITNKLFKNPKTTKAFGLIELLIGLILFVLALLLR